MNANLYRMISLHDLKHDGYEKFQVEVDDDFKEIGTRINTEVHDAEEKLDTAKRELLARIEGLRAELLTNITLTTKTTTQTTSSGPGPLADASKLLKDLEKWKYLLMGAIFMLGWMLAHIKWSVLLSLFGG
jgi:hypothetical protein